MDNNSLLINIAQEIKESGGRMFYVGGFVRDTVMGKESKDIDVEIYNISPDILVKILSSYGEIDLIGKSFGILKIKGIDIDFAMPRLEKKIGEGHKGFEISVNPFCSFGEACMRRDFTMNSMLMDVLTGEIIDPYHGKTDINNKLIRHINDKTFAEDPLRVYRAVQFAGRLMFSLHPKTIELCRSMELCTLPKERIFEELKKLLLKSSKPSIGLRLMVEMNLLKKMHPLLDTLIGCPQDIRFHPEGDVWEHTLLVVDEAANLREKSQNPTVLMFSALCHDLGKPCVTQNNGNGRITSNGHDEVGGRLAREFMETITKDKKIIMQVETMSREHMHPYALYYNNASDNAVRRLSARVDIEELLLLAEADYNGRAVYEGKNFEPVKRWFRQKIEYLRLNEKINPLVTGRDLIALGLSPGPSFKNILDKAMELQLGGGSKDQIIMQIKEIWNI